MRFEITAKSRSNYKWDGPTSIPQDLRRFQFDVSGYLSRAYINQDMAPKLHRFMVEDVHRVQAPKQGLWPPQINVEEELLFDPRCLKLISMDCHHARSRF